MRIVFGIMSAVQSAGTIGNLADALGTRHPILIHHDWSQQPDFVLSRPNVSFVQNPQRTGWADWGFSLGILRLVREAVESGPFDYFQLLSPTCLPVRPIAAFESHLELTSADFLVDAVRLDSDPNVLMSHGWRAFASAGSARQRVLRKARHWYFGKDAPIISRNGLSFPESSLADADGLTGTRARLARSLTMMASRGNGFSHTFGDDFPCYAGSTWFTASRAGCQYLLERGRDEELTRRFASLHMGDEMYFPSLFMNSGLPCAPAVHYIARFVDARPAWFELENLAEIRESRAFFARKFPEDPDSPVRAAARSLLLQQSESRDRSFEMARQAD